ncbi:hypothetical protein DCM78_31410 [Bradyrhizobium sp. WBOS04]|nr:hypothetical protein DCM78_31410 [Bradyrhizobium sp. WBOS04]
MIKNKMDEVLDGQISIFDLVLNEVKEPKKEYAQIPLSFNGMEPSTTNTYCPLYFSSALCLFSST